MSANESKNEVKGSNKGITSIDALRKSAERVRKNLDSKIDKLTKELQAAQGERAELGQFFGEKKGTRKGARRSSGNRVNWSEVLSALPEQFGAKDVAALPVMADRPANQIAPAIHRWTQSGQVERVERGVYRRVSEPATTPAEA